MVSRRLPVVLTREEFGRVLERLRGSVRVMVTLPPAMVEAERAQHMERVRWLHRRDLKAGAGWVEFPAEYRHDGSGVRIAALEIA